LQAIYDYLRNTTSEPPAPMKSTAAYSYVTPAMMLEAIELFGWDDFSFVESEERQIDVYTRDLLLKIYYEARNMEFKTETRPGGPENGMPLITRNVFSFFIGLHVLADPVSLLLK
jgi:hypothetical protein